MIVHTAVAHGTAVQHHRMVEQVAVAIRRVLQAVDEIADLVDVVLVEFGKFSQLLRPVAVMGQRVERGVHAAVRIHPRTDVASHLEGRDTRHVGRERQHLEVEHHAYMIDPGVRHAHRRLGQVNATACRVLRFDQFNPALDLPHVFEVVV